VRGDLVLVSLHFGFERSGVFCVLVEPIGWVLGLWEVRRTWGLVDRVRGFVGVVMWGRLVPCSALDHYIDLNLRYFNSLLRKSRSSDPLFSVESMRTDHRFVNFSLTVIRVNHFFADWLIFWGLNISSKLET
ncbi:hypothetical protein M758_10G117800, partial [Ceratodon purpureus]